MSTPHQFSGDECPGRVHLSIAAEGLVRAAAHAISPAVRHRRRPMWFCGI